MVRLILVISIFVISSSIIYAEEGSKTMQSPYGEGLTPYGVCKKPMKVHEAMHAMEQYFKKKGLTIEMLEHRGRFIYVNIYKGNKQVDRIILDRKTSRMRSIY
jgi:hypothetical protein